MEALVIIFKDIFKIKIFLSVAEKHFTIKKQTDLVVESKRISILFVLWLREAPLKVIV